MTNTKHTPTPWESEVVYNNGEGTYSITSWDATTSSSREICQLTRADDKRNGLDYDAEVEEANSAYIVRAVNAHEALVEALEDALAALKKYAFGNQEVSYAEEFAFFHKQVAALKLAKGE